MKEIWFIRHGESTGNIGILSSNDKDISLTEKGIEQAQAVVNEITKRPDLIVATPFIRTQQTAEPTRTKFPDVPYEIWNLQEFTCLCRKRCASLSKEDRKPMRDEYWGKNDPELVHGVGTESFSNMVNRIKTTFNKIAESNAEFITIFTHGFILRTMITMLKNPEANNKELMEMVKSGADAPILENCQIIKTKYADNSLKLLNF